MPTDPLAPLLDLADVAPAFSAAQAKVDDAMRHRALRRHGGRVAAEISLRSAVASAGLEGHAYDLEDVRAGTVTDPVVQGALRIFSADLADLWLQAPRQALARLHVLAAGGVVPAAELGRPSSAADRIDALSALVVGNSAWTTPPMLLAAVVHAELLTLRPFAGPAGVVARAAARLTLIGRSFDPRGLVAADVGHRLREPEYVGASGAYATGTPDGLRSWLRHYAAAVEAGADELITVGDGVLAAA